MKHFRFISFCVSISAFTFAALCVYTVRAEITVNDYVWQNASGNWADTAWLSGDLVTPKTDIPGSTSSAYVTAGSVTAAAKASVLNLTISGGSVTVNGLGTGSAEPVLNVTGTLDVQAGASLTYAAGSSGNFNCIAAGTTLTGAGDIIVTGSTTTINSTKTDGFTGTIHIKGGPLWLCGSTLKNATISLEGNDLRNNGNNSPSANVEIASKIVINSTGGGIHPGWSNRCFTLSGVISDGTANTLNIVRDSNDNNWVVLTNANNTYTNLLTYGATDGNLASKVRVTNTGALGAITGTVTNNGHLDLYGSSNSADNGATFKTITGNGMVMNNKSNTTAALYLGANSALTIRDSFNNNTSETVTNAKMSVFTKAAGATSAIYLSASGSNYSGGLTVIQGITASSYGNAFGTGTVTLMNGTTLFNNTYSVEISNEVKLNGSGSVRAGWRTNSAVTHVSGNITDGTAGSVLNLHYGEGTPSVIMFSGNNTYTGGTKFNDTTHYNLIINTNSAFGTGTFNTADANTTLDFNTGGTWGYASFNSLSQKDSAIFGFNYDLSNRTVTLGVSGYTTKVTAEKSGTLSFKRANDTSNIYITDLTAGTRTTLFSAADANYTLTAGHEYQFDVRYPSDTTGNFTVSEDGNTYSNLKINQDGSWSGISSVISSAKNWTLSTPFNIGTKTLMLTNTGIGNAAFAGTVDGTGTISFNGARNGAMGVGIMAFDGSPLAADDAFNVSVAANTRFTGNGTVGGNLTLADKTAFHLSKEEGDLAVSGNITLQGNTEFVIDLTNITADTNWGSLAAASTAAGFTDDNLKFKFTGTMDASRFEDPLTLSVFGGTDFSGQISTSELAGILDFSTLAGDAVISAFLTNDGLMFQVGSHAALPEPSAWVLLTLGAVLLGFRKRMKRQ